MKPRIRPLANLFHRWGAKLGLDAEQVANALEAARLIERIGADSYRETTRERVPREEFERMVSEALSSSGGKS
jgi:hypothetical protein